MKRSLFLFLGSLALTLPAQSAEAPRYTASFQTSYEGAHPNLFAQQQDRVRTLIQLAQLEVTAKLGLLQYKEGFRCPLTVRFDDTPAPGAEHALAYVRFQSGGQCGQEMVVNLDVMANYTSDFDPIFYHEMTHAVLNDAIVFETQRRLPAWVQEGLAVYVSGEGEARVKAYAQLVGKSDVYRLVHELQDNAVDYPGNYLAFRYLLDKHSINALQGFVRYMTQGQSAPEAIFEATNLSWDEFRRRVRDYTLSTYHDLAPLSR